MKLIIVRLPQHRVATVGGVLGVVAIAAGLAVGCGDDALTPGPTAGGSSGDTGDRTTSDSVTTGEPESTGNHDTTDTTGAVGVCPQGVAMGSFAGKPVVDVSLDGGESLPFIVDTGAPTTIVDPSVLDSLGPGPFTLDIAQQRIDAGSLDRFAVSQVFPGIMGIMGTDLLGGFAIHFDYPRERFWLSDGIDEADLQACDHVEADPVTAPAEYFGGYVFVPGAMEGLDGWVLLDTGASIGAVTDTAFARLQATAPRPALQGFYTEAIIGTFWADLTTVGSITVSGRDVASVLHRTIPQGQLPHPSDDRLPMLGLLPSGYLRHFLVTLDLDSATLRLDRAAGDDGHEPAQYFPLGIGTVTSTATPVVVGQVLPGSSAQEHDVRIGDEIVTVGGQRFDLLGPSNRPWALVTTQPGTTTTVGLRRGGEPFTVTLEGRDLLRAP